MEWNPACHVHSKKKTSWFFFWNGFHREESDTGPRACGPVGPWNPPCHVHSKKKASCFFFWNGFRREESPVSPTGPRARGHMSRGPVACGTDRRLFSVESIPKKTAVFLFWGMDVTGMIPRAHGPVCPCPVGSWARGPFHREESDTGPRARGPVESCLSRPFQKKTAVFFGTHILPWKGILLVRSIQKKRFFLEWIPP